MVRVVPTDLMPDFTGHVLNRGRFRLLESLGAGAYGKVYRALDIASASNQTCYAVKCLNKPKPGSHTDVLQQREFALHKLVSGHPNIITFYEFFSDALYVYVVLDLCLGGDLFAAITEKHLFHNNGWLVKRAFIQLVDAVQYCHDLGVFHRDIKPENVLLCSTDGANVRLADFGLSIKSPVCRDFGCGSSYYMSPGMLSLRYLESYTFTDHVLRILAECIDREITSGKYSTRHNDVWALGVILTNMITGRNPWRYATADDDCFSAYLHDNNFLLQVLPISEGVNTILKRIFRINPLRRITLPQLRQGILELTTFFVDEAPAATREAGVSRTAKAVTQLPAQAKHQESTSSKDTLISSGDSSTDSLTSEEHYIFASPVDDHPLLMSSTLPRISESGISTHFSNFVIGESCGSLCPPSSGSSGSSRPESKGPITPVTYPADPAIDVPDIPEQDGLGQPGELSGISVIHKISAISVGMKEKKTPGHLFRSALQRIKGLSAT